MKKGPLSKQEKTYVEENHETTTATIMADKMNRSVQIVDKYIAKLTSSVKEKTKTSETVTSTLDSSSLYARDKNKIATIMTEAASAAGDESRKKAEMPSRYKGMIHKIKEG